MSFICVEDDPESRTRCREQCGECAEIERRERENKPPADRPKVAPTTAWPFPKDPRP